LESVFLSKSRRPFFFMRLLAVCLGVFFLATLNLPAQSFNAAAHKTAMKLFDLGEYREAISSFQEAIQGDPEAQSNLALEANFFLGVCYLKLGEGGTGLPYMQKVYELDKDYYPEIEFMMGQCAKNALKFREALTYYENFLKVEGVKKDPVMLAEVTKNMDECQVALELMKNPVKVKIENVGPIINSPFPDYTPVITADESILIFTSRREGNVGKQTASYLDQEEEFPTEDIYQSTRINDKWTAPVNLGSPVNTDEHDAAIALSPDGSQMFIYKADKEGDIYLSKKKGLQWTQPKSLGDKINLPKSSELSCSITADGRTLYFSSNRPGGYGGLDIWKSTLVKGEWSEPANMGPKINTKEDEDAPFIHPDGITLYYSSKGKKTMGGYDIFRTTLERAGWSEPENMGYPINSVQNDIYFVLSADNRHGYYASFHEGGYGKHDIFMISMAPAAEVKAIETVQAKTRITSDKPSAETAGKAPRPAPVSLTSTKSRLTLLKGIITDAVTRQPMEAKITVVNIKNGQSLSELSSNEATGSYLVVLPAGKNYAITVTAPGYLFHSENIDISDTAEYQEVLRDVALNKAQIGARIVLRNIFFDFDKATLRPESNLELDRVRKVMLDYPNMKIEISGHTDNKGSAEYNKKLSESRAKAVLDYLVRKGISPDRMTFAGYGFEKPLTGNETEEGRQLNRRTEFEVKGFK
jgi:outer membrane protein OmpA-like peptidoglycan-associated protein